MASKISSATISFLLLSLLLTLSVQGVRVPDEKWTCPNNVLGRLSGLTGILGLLGGDCSPLGNLSDEQATICLCVALDSLNLVEGLLAPLLHGCGHKPYDGFTTCVGLL